MKLSIGTYIFAAIAVVIGAFIVFGTFSAPTTEAMQRGYRGVALDQIYHRADVARLTKVNAVPDAIPQGKPGGQKASAVYQNLKVLGDLDVGEFNRLMASMAMWVAPTQSCNYCHSADGNFASDALYTKKVARRMLQMTRHINADWKKHVAETGVTCYTCHRGQPVPAYVWYEKSGPETGTMLASAKVGAIQGDAFQSYLNKSDEIRVISNVALPGKDKQSIIDAENTASLMIHFSNSLGVNCTFCHNTRSFAAWDQSSPQRVTAWYGIRMVRDLNEHYLDSLKGVFPQARLGPHGDVPKVNCLTCHQGASKPLLGAKMAKDYPELLVTNDVASAKPEEKKPDDAKPQGDQPKPQGDQPQPQGDQPKQ